MEGVPSHIGVFIEQETFEDYLEDRELTSVQWEAVRSDFEGELWEFTELLITKYSKLVLAGEYDKTPDHESPRSGVLR